MLPSPANTSLSRKHLSTQLYPSLRRYASRTSHCTACSSTRDDSSDGSSKPEPCRRMLLLSVAACISTSQSISGKATAAALVPSLPAAPATGLALDCPDGETKQLIGKPGFRLRYPADWVVAFVSVFSLLLLVFQFGGGTAMLTVPASHCHLPAYSNKCTVSCRRQSTALPCHTFCLSHKSTPAQILCCILTRIFNLVSASGAVLY